MKDAARDSGKEVAAEINVDENRLALPQCAMGFACGYHSNDVSAYFASIERVGIGPPLHKDARLQPNADPHTVVGVFTPSAARLVGRIDTVAIAFKPEML